MSASALYRTMRLSMLTLLHGLLTSFHTNKCSIYLTIMSKACENSTQFWTKREVALSVKSKLLPRLELYMNYLMYSSPPLFHVHAKILCASAGIISIMRKKQRLYAGKRQKRQNIQSFLQRRQPPSIALMAISLSIPEFLKKLTGKLNWGSLSVTVARIYLKRMHCRTSLAIPYSTMSPLVTSNRAISNSLKERALMGIAQWGRGLSLLMKLRIHNNLL